MLGKKRIVYSSLFLPKPDHRVPYLYICMLYVYNRSKILMQANKISKKKKKICVKREKRTNDDDDDDWAKNMHD